MVSKMLMTMFFICMIAGNMALIYVFQKYTESLDENSKQQLELLHQRAEIDRLSKIAEWNDNYNEFVHNTSHYLKVIGHLAYEGKNDEICKVVDKLNGTLNRVEISQYSTHRMLNTILSEYSQKAKKEGIVLDVYVEPGCILDCIQDMDLVAILGNLLDNAVLAASKKEEETTVVVRIFMQKDGTLCVIKVVNDFEGEIKEAGGKLISTKTEKGLHGIGLASVSKISKQYGGDFQYYITDGKFHAIVVLSV